MGSELACNGEYRWAGLVASLITAKRFLSLKGGRFSGLSMVESDQLVTRDARDSELWRAEV